MPDEIILIAAVTIDGYISRHSHDRVDWSKDLHLFKKQTMGFPVIMGSNTRKTISTKMEGREQIVITRHDNPKTILAGVKKHKCFIIGGGITNHRFINYITHIYITPHPYIFGGGVPLFKGSLKNNELSIQFLNLVSVDVDKGIYQYQYRVIKK